LGGGAAIVHAAALVNPVIPLTHTFELRKWRADSYLRPKLEALRNLHVAMVRCHYAISRHAKARMPQNIQEFREQVERREMEFFDALTTAEIYLDSEMSKAIHNVLGAVRQMTGSIWRRLPENAEQTQYSDIAIREPDWGPFTSSFDAADAKLGVLLNPNELMKWIEK